MNGKILKYLLSANILFITAILSYPLEDGSDNPELGLYYEGDMLNPPWTEDDLKSGVNSKSRRWPDKTLVYKIDKKFSTAQRKLIKKAMDEIRNKTKCIKFRRGKETKSEYYVLYKKNETDGCHSAVGYRPEGKQQTSQIISLASSCFSMKTKGGKTAPSHGTPMHETIHALGFGHEHTRPDRNKSVTILWANIQNGKKNNFEVKRGQTRTFGVPYDYDSIMHYGADFFGKGTPPAITIQVKDRKAKGRIGQRKELSRRDVLKLRAMYECK